ncbi:Ig-like domain-containing protein [Planctomycetota bacterium]
MFRPTLISSILVRVMVMVALFGLLTSCGGGGGGGGSQISNFTVDGGDGGGGGGGGDPEPDEDLGVIGIGGNIVGNPGGSEDEGGQKNFFNDSFEIPGIGNPSQNTEDESTDDDDDSIFGDLRDTSGNNWTSSGLTYQELLRSIRMTFLANGIPLGDPSVVDEDGNFHINIDLNDVQENLITLRVEDADTLELLYELLLPISEPQDDYEYLMQMVMRADRTLMVGLRRVIYEDGAPIPVDSTNIIAELVTDRDGDGVPDQVNTLFSDNGLILIDANANGVFGEPVRDAVYDLDGDGEPDVVLENANHNSVFNEDPDDDIAGLRGDDVDQLMMRPLVGERISQNVYRLSVGVGVEVQVPLFVLVDYDGDTPYGAVVNFEFEGDVEILSSQYSSVIEGDLGYGRAFTFGPIFVPGTDPGENHEIQIRAYVAHSDGILAEENITYQIKLEENAIPELTSLSVEEGTPVTPVLITGSGFSSTLSQNTVKFDDTPAFVLSATTTQIITVVPSQALDGDVQQVVQVSVVTNGKPSAESLPFTILPPGPTLTEQDISPYLSEEVPSNSSLILEFNKEIDENTIEDGITIVDVDSGGTPYGDEIVGNSLNFTYNASVSPYVKITPATRWTEGEQYGLIITSGLKDTDGNPFDAFPGGSSNAFEKTFTATSNLSSGPELTSITPASGSTAVSASTAITINFDAPIDPITFDGDGFSLTDGSGSEVAGSFSFTSGYTVATFQPSTALAGATQYTITMTDQLAGPTGHGVTNGLAEEIPAGLSGTILYAGTFQTSLYISQIQPISGSSGTEVSITGSGLSSEFGENVVTFNGATAEIISIVDNGDNTVTLICEVPNGATSGLLVVSKGSVSSPGTTFTVTISGIETKAITLGQGPSSVTYSPDGNTLVVTNQNAGTVSFVDMSTGLPVKIGDDVPTAPVSTEVLWAQAGDAGETGDRIFVLHFGTPTDAGNTMMVLDPETKTVTDFVQVGTRPTRMALSADGTKVYVTNFVDGTVSVVDVESLEMESSFSVGLGPDGIGLTPDGKKGYVCNYFADTVTVFDTSTNLPSGTIEVGDGPARVEITPDGSYGFVTNFNDSTVSVVDTETNNVISTVTVGSSPADLTFAPDGSRAYVTGRAADVVTIIGIPDFTVKGYISTGHGPSGCTITPDGSNLYVTNLFDDTLSVIFLQKAAHTITELIRPFGDEGEEITITGTDFDESANVFFNGLQATVTFDSETQLRATVPQDATIGPVTVVQNDITSNSLNFEVTPDLPEVLGVSPATEAGAVPRETTIRIQFNEPIKIDTVTGASFYLEPANWNPPGSGIEELKIHSADENFAQAFELTLNGDLQPNTTYTIHVTTAVKDAANKGMDAEWTSTFTTADATPPAMTGAIFTDEDINGIDQGDSIIVSFDETVFNETLSSAGSLSASALFELGGSSSDTLGSGATVVRDATLPGSQVKILLGSNPSLTVASAFGTATYLEYVGNCSAECLTDVSGNGVSQETTVDIGSDDFHDPYLETVVYNSSSGKLDLYFNEAVYFSPSGLDKVLMSPVDGQFAITQGGTLGSNATFQIDSSDARHWTITPGSNADFIAAGVYDSGAPNKGGLYLTGSGGEFGDIAGNAADTGLLSAVDIGQTTSVGPKVASAVYSDEDGNGIDTGDTIAVTVDTDVTVSSVSIDDFALNVAGDSFGSGASAAHVSGRNFRITLGNTPILTIAGTFNKNYRETDSPSGLDFTAGEGTGIADTHGNPAQDLNIVGADDNGVDITDVDTTALSLLSAEFVDVNANDLIDADDKIECTFNKAPHLGSSYADEVFSLPVLGDRFGTEASLTIDPSDGTIAVITLDVNPVLNPGGDFSAQATDFGDSSGINVIAGSQYLTDLNGNPPVAGSAVDIDSAGLGTAPSIQEALFWDMTGDGPGSGDEIELTFSTAVDFATDLGPADFSLSSGSLGTGAQFFRLEQDVAVIILGTSAQITLSAADPSEIGVQLTSVTKITDQFGNNIGSGKVDITSNDNSDPYLIDAVYEDANLDGMLSSGDKIHALFNEAVTFTSTNALTQFVLFNQNIGYDLGNNASLVKAAAKNQITIVLGTGPELVVAGLFSSNFTEVGSSTGLGMDAGNNDITDLSGNLVDTSVIVDIRSNNTSAPYLVSAFGMQRDSQGGSTTVLGPGDVLIAIFNEPVLVGSNAGGKAFYTPVVGDNLGSSLVDRLNFTTNRQITSTPSEDDTTPCIAFASETNQFLSAWVRDSQIRYRLLGPDGRPTGSEGILVNGTAPSRPGLFYAPSGGSSSGVFLLVWEDNGNVNAQLFSTTGIVIAGTNTVLDAGSQWAGTYNGMAANPDTFLVTWNPGAGNMEGVAIIVSDDDIDTATLGGIKSLAGVTSTIVGVGADYSGDYGLLYQDGQDMTLREVDSSLANPQSVVIGSTSDEPQGLAFSQFDGLWTVLFKDSSNNFNILAIANGLQRESNPRLIRAGSAAGTGAITVNQANGLITAVMSDNVGNDGNIYVSLMVALWELGEPNMMVLAKFPLTGGEDTAERNNPKVINNTSTDAALVVWQDGREAPNLTIWGQQVGMPPMVFKNLPGLHLGPKQVGVVLGSKAKLTTLGQFNINTTVAGSPSGIDINADILKGAITDIDGNTAVDLGLARSNDSGIDIESRDLIPPSIVCVEYIPDVPTFTGQGGSGALSPGILVNFDEPVKLASGVLGPAHIFELESSNNTAGSFGSGATQELLWSLLGADNKYYSHSLIITLGTDPDVVLAGFYPDDATATGLAYRDDATPSAALTDTNGNELVADSFFDIFFNAGATGGLFEFMGSNPPDFTPSVPLDTNLEGFFSEEIDATTLTAANVYLREFDSANTISASLSLDAWDANKIIIAPDNNLNPGTTYELVFSTGLMSIYGESLNEIAIVTFTTAYQDSTNDFYLLNSIPPMDASNAPVGITVNATFSDTVDNLTVTDSNVYMRAIGGTSNVSVTLNTLGSTVSLDPVSDLAPDTVYEVIFTTNLKSNAGQYLPYEVYLYFGTGGTGAGAEFAFAGSQPVDYGYDIPTDVMIYGYFNETVKESTVSDTNVFLYKEDGTPVDITVSRDVANTNTIVITPDSELLPGTGYAAIFTMGLTNESDYSLPDNVYVHFRTGFTGFGFIGSQPENGATDVNPAMGIGARFSQTVDEITITNANVVFQIQGGGAVSYTPRRGDFLATLNDDRVVYIELDEMLTAGTTYEMIFNTGLQSITGQNLPAAQTVTFTVGGAAEAFRYLHSWPEDNGPPVYREVYPFAEFSMPVNSNTVSSNVFLKQGGNPVSANISVDSEYPNSIRIQPTNFLDAGTTYTMEFKTGLQSTSGESLASDVTITFTTMASSFALNNSWPNDGDISIQTSDWDCCWMNAWFSDPVAASTVSGNVNLRVQGGSSVSAAISVDTYDLYQIKIQPYGDLQPGTTYEIVFGPGLSSTYGDTLGTQQTVTFTTITDGFAFMHSWPMNNDDFVPLSIQPWSEFTETVDPTTVTTDNVIFRKKYTSEAISYSVAVATWNDATIVIMLNQDLEPQTTYEMVFTTGLRSYTSGENLPANVTVTFDTMSNQMGDIYILEDTVGGIGQKNAKNFINMNNESNVTFHIDFPPGGVVQDGYALTVYLNSFEISETVSGAASGYMEFARDISGLGLEDGPVGLSAFIDTAGVNIYPQNPPVDKDTLAPQLDLDSWPQTNMPLDPYINLHFRDANNYPDMVNIEMFTSNVSIYVQGDQSNTVAGTWYYGSGGGNTTCSDWFDFEPSANLSPDTWYEISLDADTVEGWDMNAVSGFTIAFQTGNESSSSGDMFIVEYLGGGIGQNNRLNFINQANVSNPQVHINIPSGVVAGNTVQVEFEDNYPNTVSSPATVTAFDIAQGFMTVSMPSTATLQDGWIGTDAQFFAGGTPVAGAWGDAEKDLNSVQFDPLASWPQAGSIDVPVDETIYLNFEDPNGSCSVNIQTLMNNISITDPLSNPVFGTWDYDMTGEPGYSCWFEFTPNVSMDPDSQYNVSLAASLVEGWDLNPVPGFAFSFTTGTDTGGGGGPFGMEDSEPAHLDTNVPADWGAEFFFNRSIDSNTINYTNVRLYQISGFGDTGQGTPVSTSLYDPHMGWTDQSVTLGIYPENPLLEDTYYRVIIENLQTMPPDPEILTEQIIVEFQTGSGFFMNMYMTMPKDGSTDEMVYEYPWLEFTRQVNPSFVTTSYLKLFKLPNGPGDETGKTEVTVSLFLDQAMGGPEEGKSIHMIHDGLDYKTWYQIWVSPNLESTTPGETLPGVDPITIEFQTQHDDLYIVEDLVGGIGYENNRNFINLSNVSAPQVYVKIPAGVAAGDTLEIEIEDNDFMSISSAPYTLTDVDVNTNGYVIRTMPTAVSLDEGRVEVIAEFFNGGSPIQELWTNAVKDTTPPYVLHTMPEDGELNADPDEPIDVHFHGRADEMGGGGDMCEEIDYDYFTANGCSMVDVTDGNSPVSGTYSTPMGSSDSIWFTPAAALITGHQYRVTIDYTYVIGKWDLNAAPPATSYISTFTVGTGGFAFDWSDPEDGETGVSTNYEPIVQFTDDLNYSTVNSTNVKLARLDEQYGSIVDWVTINPIGNLDQIYLNNYSPLLLNTDTWYRIWISGTLESWDNDPLDSPVEIEFQTGSGGGGFDLDWGTTYPANNAVDIPLSTEPILRFTEDVDVASVTPGYIKMFKLFSQGGAVDYEITLDLMRDGTNWNEVHLNNYVDLTLTVGTWYRIWISEFFQSDTAVPLGVDTELEFTTGTSGGGFDLDWGTTYPANNAVDIPLSTEPILHFTQNVDVASVTPGYIKMYKLFSQGGAVDYEITLDLMRDGTNWNEVHLNNYVDLTLTVGTWYRIWISEFFQSDTAVPLGVDTELEFTTGTGGGGFDFDYMNPVCGQQNDKIAVVGSGFSTDLQNVYFDAISMTSGSDYDVINDNLLIFTLPLKTTGQSYTLELNDGTDTITANNGAINIFYPEPAPSIDTPAVGMDEAYILSYDWTGAINRNECPNSITAVENPGGPNLCVFTTTLNNLVRIDINSTTGMLDSHVTLNLDTAGYTGAPAQFAAHPDPGLGCGYVAIDQTVAIIDTIYGSPMTTSSVNLGATPGNTTDVAVSSCGGYLAASTDANRLYIAELDEFGDPVATAQEVTLDYTNPVDEITSLRFAPDGSYLYVTYWEYDAVNYLGCIDQVNLATQIATRKLSADSSFFGYAPGETGIDDIAISPDMTFAYISDCIRGGVYRIDMSTFGLSTGYTNNEVTITDLEPSRLAVDWINNIVYVSSSPESTSVITVIEDTGSDLVVTDRFVPGVDNYGLELLHYPSASAMFPYTLFTASGMGTNEYFDQPDGSGGFQMALDPGNIPQLFPAFNGLLHYDGQKIFDDPAISGNTLRITVYDATSGMPLPGAIGWINDPNNGGTVVTGYQEETSGYFEIDNPTYNAGPGSIDLLFDGGSISSFNHSTHLTTSGQFSVTVARQGAPGVPFDPVTIWNIDASSTVDHIIIGLLPAEGPMIMNQESAKVAGTLDGSNVSIDWGNDTTFGDVIIATDGDSDGDMDIDSTGFYTVEVQAGVPNLLIVAVGDDTAISDPDADALKGYGEHMLPRIHRGVCWQYMGTPSSGFDYGPEFYMISGVSTTLFDLGGNPAQVYVPDLSSSVFDIGSLELEIEGTILNTDPEYQTPPRFNLLGASSCLAGYRDNDSPINQSSLNNLEMRLFLQGRSQFDYYAFLCDNNDNESGSRAPGLPSTTDPLPDLKIMEPPSLTAPAPGDFIVGTLNVQAENIFKRTATDRETILSDSASQITQGTMYFEVESEGMWWELIYYTNSAGPDPISFNWPQLPSGLAASSWDFQDNALCEIEMETFGLTSTASEITIGTSGVSKTSQRAIESQHVHFSETSRVEFSFGTETGGFLPLDSGTPVARSGHAAKVSERPTYMGSFEELREIIIAGGEEESSGTVQTMNWGGGTLNMSSTFGATSGPRVDPLIFQARLDASGSYMFPEQWQIMGGVDAVPSLFTDPWLFCPSMTTIYEDPLDPDTRADLAFGRVGAELVDIWWENIGFDTDERSHLHLIIGGSNTNGDPIGSTSYPGDPIEIFIDGDMTSDFNGTFASVNIISGIFTPRTRFQTVLLADYAEEDDEGTELGMAWILVFGGFDEFGMPINSVQLLEVDYGNPLNGTDNNVYIDITDLDPMNMPRADFSATPAFYLFNIPTDHQEFMEQNLDSLTGTKEIFIAGGTNASLASEEMRGIPDYELYTFTYNFGAFNGTVENSYMLQIERYGHAAVAHGGTYAFGPDYIYLIGGAEAGMPSPDPSESFYSTILAIEEINVVAPGPTLIANFLQRGRIGHTATKFYNDIIAETQIMIYGGRDKGVIIGSTLDPGGTGDIVEIFAPDILPE